MLGATRCCFPVVRVPPSVPRGSCSVEAWTGTDTKLDLRMGAERSAVVP